MKILYVAIKYDYGKKERGFSPQHNNFYSTLLKMNRGREEIVYFPYDEVMAKVGREEMNKTLLEVALKEKLDIIFFLTGDDCIKKEIIKEISEKSGAATVAWCSDDRWKFHNYTKYWAPLYHWQVTTEKDNLPYYEKMGYKNVILSQWGFDHFAYKPLDLSKIYDVTFVGAAHGDRKKIVEKLKSAGIRVECWGSGWPNGRVSQDEMLRIWSQSRINLNFTKSGGVWWKELASIFLYRRYDSRIRLRNPKYWLDTLKTAYFSLFEKQTKGRTFEVPGLRTFFLTESIPHLQDYYKIGKEIDVFDTVADLIAKINYYLEHEDEREAIAKAGYERTIRDHTWEKRFNEIFKTMGFPV